MEDLLHCALCSEPYDIDDRRPTSLICGDAICRQCVNDPTWRRDCPVCVQVDHRTYIPDNKLVIQIMGTGGEQAAEEGMEESEDKPADTTCDTQLQMERGLEAGHALIARLELEVPTAVQSLRHLLDKAVSNTQMLKVADCVLRQTGGPDVYSATDHATTQMISQQLQLAEKLQEGYSILSGGDSQWVADDSLRRQGSLGRLMLLKMQMEGERTGRKKLAAEPGPAWPPQAAELPLEEVRIQDGDDARVMEAVRSMRSLRRLRVAYRSSADEHPDLPLTLHELAITNASEKDLLRVQRMHALQRLMVDGYDGPYVSFDASARPPVAGLREVAVDFKGGHINTLISLVCAHAATLSELAVGCALAEGPQGGADTQQYASLGAVLAACGLAALRRLVLERQHGDHLRAACDKQCKEVLAQLGAGGADVSVVCRQCGDLPAPFWKLW